MYVCTYVRMYVCIRMYVCMYVCTYVCMYACYILCIYICVCVYVCLYAYRHPYNPYIMSHESWSTVVLWNWLMPVPACQAKHLELEWSSLQFLGTSGQTQIKCCMHMPYAYAYVNRLYTCIYICICVCAPYIWLYMCIWTYAWFYTSSPFKRSKKVW